MFVVCWLQFFKRSGAPNWIYFLPPTSGQLIFYLQIKTKLEHMLMDFFVVMFSIPKQSDICERNQIPFNLLRNGSPHPDWEKSQQLSARLSPLGIMGNHLRALIKNIDIIVPWWSRGSIGGCIIGHPWCRDTLVSK